MGIWKCTIDDAYQPNHEVNQANENGLRGRSGERGLNALAKRSSESVLEVRTRGGIEFIEFIEFKEANPLGSMFCWASWRNSGGNWATALSESAPAGLIWMLGVGVVLVSGVGIECNGLLETFLNELKEDTATSGD